MGCALASRRPELRGRCFRLDEARRAEDDDRIRDAVALQLQFGFQIIEIEPYAPRRVGTQEVRIFGTLAIGCAVQEAAHAQARLRVFRLALGATAGKRRAAPQRVRRLWYLAAAGGA